MSTTAPIELHLLNLGAGVQSTFLYLMAYLSAVMNGELEGSPWSLKTIASMTESERDFVRRFPYRFDYSIFADTQDEQSHTMRNLQWLISLKGSPILSRTRGSIRSDLVTIDTGNGRFATIPAYTENGGKVQRQCTKEYKLEVIAKCIRRELLGLEPGQRVPKGTKVHQYFGISLDEMGRAGSITRAMRRPFDEDSLEFCPDDDFAWAEPHFPLVDAYITRAHCESFLSGKTPELVEQSACKICPQRDKFNWARMARNHPEEFAEAVEFDRAIREIPGLMIQRGLSEPLYLDRECKPLDEIDLPSDVDPRKSQLGINFADECLGVCGS
jgi:hypothetical protein